MDFLAKCHSNQDCHCICAGTVAIWGKTAASIFTKFPHFCENWDLCFGFKWLCPRLFSTDSEKYKNWFLDTLIRSFCLWGLGTMSKVEISIQQNLFKLKLKFQQNLYSNSIVRPQLVRNQLKNNYSTCLLWNPCYLGFKCGLCIKTLVFFRNVILMHCLMWTRS